MGPAKEELGVPAWFVRLSSIFMGLIFATTIGAVAWASQVTSTLSAISVRLERQAIMDEQMRSMQKEIDRLQNMMASHLDRHE